MFSAVGTIRDVVYLGLFTRYLVNLEDGVDLVVIEQNINSTSMDVLKKRGKKIRLSWNKEHISRVGN